MFKSRLLSILTLAVLALCPLSLLAASSEAETSENGASKFLEKNKDLEKWCEEKPPLPAEAKVFPETKVKAENIRADFCNIKITNKLDLGARIINLLNDLGRLFPESQIHLQMISQEMSRASSTGEVAQFEVESAPILFVSLDHVSVYRIKGDVLEECNTKAKKISPDTDCKRALDEFETIYNFAQGTLAQPIALELSERLSAMEAEWTDFFDKSKSQTIWEMAINGSIFQGDNEEHRFSEPPDWQLVVLHPRIVVENVSAAVDGQQLRTALMVELVGADWWRQDRWYLPSGGSFIATYSDRSEVDDWAPGIALNFASQFTLGATVRDIGDGNDVGIFISMDLLKLLQGKTSILESYRNSVDF